MAIGATTRSTSSGELGLRLPEPQTRGGMPLAEALATRRSHREFADEPVSIEHVAQNVLSVTPAKAPADGQLAVA